MPVRLAIVPSRRSVPEGRRSASIRGVAGPGPNQRAVRHLVLQIGIRIPSIFSADPMGWYSYPPLEKLIRPLLPMPPKPGSGELNQLSITSVPAGSRPGPLALDVSLWSGGIGTIDTP